MLNFDAVKFILKYDRMVLHPDLCYHIIDGYIAYLELCSLLLPL